MQQLLDPAILFFAFGVLAGALRSNLEIPRSIAKFLSLYLLMALGLKGGFALAASGLTASVLLSLGLAVAMAFIVPMLGYAFLRRRVSGYDAAALAASYGSVSAVTFVTAMQHLETAGIAVGGHMAVAMVVMESPAVLMAVLLANAQRVPAGVAPWRPGGGAATWPALAAPGPQVALGPIVREAFTDGAQLLLVGALVIGFISGESGQSVMQPFTGDLFKGLLAFFLLDMGLLVARKLPDARRAPPVLLGYAVVAPLVHATIALALAALAGLAPGDAAVLMALSASASYIVVPAVLRHAIPEANPALYVGLSLGVTFPFNILVGIPLYLACAQHVLG